VEGMWRMLQADDPDDYVLATGQGHTVREFVRLAFERAGLNWRDYVRYDANYARPTEVDALIGDASKAARLLDWKAEVFAPDLVKIMVDADIAALRCAGTPWVDKPALAGWE
ncbi:GDP-mannose 4,6-dehydratase, partial [Mycolicibacterium sp. CBMA 295]